LLQVSSRDIVATWADWEAVFDDEIRTLPSIGSVYHTSEPYKTATYEVLAVEGAIWAIIVSLLLCFTAVMIFTGAQAALVFITMISLGTMLTLVISIFVWVRTGLGCVHAPGGVQHASPTVWRHQPIV